MAMTSEQFLDLLERRGVLQQVLVDYLREQLAQSTRTIRPYMIAQRLVERGYLTAYFAKNLLAEGNAIPAGHSDEQLGLAPLPDDPRDRASRVAVRNQPALDMATLAVEFGSLEEIEDDPLAIDPALLAASRPLPPRERGMLAAIAGEHGGLIIAAVGIVLILALVAAAVVAIVY
jgi:hypothetical protein